MVSESYLFGSMVTTCTIKIHPEKDDEDKYIITEKQDMISSCTIYQPKISIK